MTNVFFSLRNRVNLIIIINKQNKAERERERFSLSDEANIGSASHSVYILSINRENTDRVYVTHTKEKMEKTETQESAKGGL